MYTNAYTHTHIQAYMYLSIHIYVYMYILYVFIIKFPNKVFTVNLSCPQGKDEHVPSHLSLHGFYFFVFLPNDLLLLSWRCLPVTYTEHEIQQWIEARRKNFPTTANIKKVTWIFTLYQIFSSQESFLCCRNWFNLMSIMKMLMTMPNYAAR